MRRPQCRSKPSFLGDVRSEIIYSIRVDAALVRAFARSSYRSGTTAAERIRRFMAASIEEDAVREAAAEKSRKAAEKGSEATSGKASE